MSIFLRDHFGFGVAAPAWTPVQKHEHRFGLFYNLLVTSHGISGLALFAFCAALARAKLRSVADERKRGRTSLTAPLVQGFAFLWLWHLGGGLVTAAILLLSRGLHLAAYDERHSFPLYLFIQFMFLCHCLIDFLAQAVHRIHRVPSLSKSPTGIAYDPRAAEASLAAFSAFSFVVGATILVWAVNECARSDFGGPLRTKECFLLVFLIQFPIYLTLSALNVRAFWLLRRGVLPARRRQIERSLLRRNLAFAVNITLVTGLGNFTYKYAQSSTPFVWATVELSAIAFVVYRHFQERVRPERSLLAVGANALSVASGDTTLS